MEKLKNKFEERERADREQFENFLAKNHDSPFLSNLLIMRMRVYQYKELLKIYAMNYKKDCFSDSRSSMYAFLLLPGAVSIGFNFVSPFSIFRRIMIVSTFLGSLASFAFSLKAELLELGKVDESPIGQEIRYRYS
jgi:hypothetical protein